MLYRQKIIGNDYLEHGFQVFKAVVMNYAVPAPQVACSIQLFEDGRYSH